MSPARKLGLLGALYLSQGLPYGFFTQALPALLRELGLSLPAIGLTSLLALPWALKFLWAPLVDRTASRRRWILGTQAAAALLALVVSLLDPAGGLAVILGCVLLSNLAAATQDIATDGLAVSLLSRGERGLGNGVQVAGYRLGMILGGGLLLILFDTLGWQGTFLCMAAMIGLASVPVLAAPDLGARPAAADGARARDAFGWLRLPGRLGWLGALLLYKTGHHLAHGMLRPWLVDAGLSLADIGWLLGTGGFTAGLLGAVAGGASVNRLGRRGALGAWGLAGAGGLAAYALVAASGSLGAGLWGAVLVEHFASGMATAALFTVMMDTSRADHAGSDYTLQASAVVLASGAAAGLSGLVAATIGYEGTFWAAAALGVVGTAGAVWAGSDSLSA